MDDNGLLMLGSVLLVLAAMAGIFRLQERRQERKEKHAAFNRVKGE